MPKRPTTWCRTASCASLTTPADCPTTDQGAEAWLVRILVNLCRDRHRRTEVRRRAAETVLKEERPEVDAESPCIARATVRAALGTLDARRRAVIVLHELEERPIKEVARLLGIAPVTARWHLSKARRQLAAELRGKETTSMSYPPTDNPLRQHLRAGDPIAAWRTAVRKTMRGACVVPSSLETSRSTGSSSPRVHQPWSRWRLAFVTAALAAAIGLCTSYAAARARVTSPDRCLDSRPHEPTGLPRLERIRTPEAPDRQIQFVTRGGTRIIWMLKPRIDS